MKVGIIGAGRIGNHLAYSARKKGWEVVVTDKSVDSLERFMNVIYPERYGAYDCDIQLIEMSKFWQIKFDLICNWIRIF